MFVFVNWGNVTSSIEQKQLKPQSDKENNIDVMIDLIIQDNYQSNEGSSIFIKTILLFVGLQSLYKLRTIYSYTLLQILTNNGN